MKGILFTSDKCEPCVEMKEQFKDLIASGEIMEENLDTNGDEAAVLMSKYNVGLPSLVILGDNGDLIMSFEKGGEHVTEETAREAGKELGEVEV